MTAFELKPIGIVHAPFKSREAIANSNKDDNIGTIEISMDYAEGLDDIDGFSHIILVCWLHRSTFHSLKVKPIYHPEKLRGIFATRHPDRPNPIAITVLELLGRKGNILKVKGIDLLDGTPVLDIKPYTRRDRRDQTNFGWLSEKKFP